MCIRSSSRKIERKMDRKKKESALQGLVCAIVACARSSQEIGRKRYGDLQTEEREEENEEEVEDSHEEAGR